MRKQICSLALSAIFGLGVAMAAPQAQDQPAQPNPPAAHRQADPNKQLERLTKRLNLTADQQNQILPILTSRDQQMQTILSDNSLSSRDRHEKMRAVREDSDVKIKAVLTDSQKQSYDQLLQQMRERAREHREQKQSPSQS